MYLWTRKKFQNIWKDKGVENVFEEIIVNLLDPGKKQIQIWGHRDSPKKIKTSRSTIKHIIMKMARCSDREF